MNYRPEIDGLRALAVIPVVLFHAGVAGFTGGFIGVDVFFVISGFLITSLIVRDLKNGDFSLIHFWERRARRILPALFVVVVVTLALGWVILTPDDLRNLANTTLAQSLFASNFIFWRQAGYFGPSASQLPLLHTWSLAVEEQFYLLFPLSMFIVTRYLIKLRWSLVALVVVVSLLISIWATDTHADAAFYLLPARAWELGLGALLALWAANTRKPFTGTLTELASAIGIAMVLFAVFAYTEATPFPGIAAALPAGGTALFIWANTGRRTMAGNLLAQKPVVFVGLISYSLYLWHWPLIVFWSYPSGSDSLGALSTVFLVAASFVIAYGSYRFVETPIRRRRFLASRKTMLGFAAALLVVLAGLGLSVRAGVLSSFRLPDSAIAYAEAGDSRSDRQVDCILDTLGSEALSDPGSLCTYGHGQGEPEFVVWGDSHADSLLHAFDKNADLFGKTGLHIARSSCPPVLDVAAARSDNCSAINTAVYDLVKTQGINTVVLSAGWTLYANDRARLTPVSGSGFDPEGTDPLSVATEGLERTVDKLLADGFDVWLIRDVPLFEFDPPRRLFGAQRFGRSIQDVGQTYEEYLARSAPFDELFAELEQRGARVINLPGTLCDEDFCPAVVDGTVLYRDSDHLSVEGSEFVAPALAPIFEERGQIAGN